MQETEIAHGRVNAPNQFLPEGSSLDNEAANVTPSEPSTVSPKAIAKKISHLLSTKGIPQRFFAEKVLKRSQGTFSDYLRRRLQEMPKMHSRSVWIRFQEFLESKEEQEELLERSNYYIM